MRFRITHYTSYRHTETVPLCQNALWLTPRTNSRQRRESHQLTISPNPSSRGSRRDYFGNEVTYFAIEAGYKSLDVAAISEVRILTPQPAVDDANSTPWEDLANGLCREHTDTAIEACQFRFDSPYASTSEDLAAYARVSFTRARPILDAVKHLTARIHADFTYEPGSTTVHTAVSHAFDLRRGVCQDFAHVEIACLRSIGLAARYVSGYLRTIPAPGQTRLVGADASHAWVSVFCGPAGWIDFDPTNNLIPSTDHIAIAWGRDYGDVTPVRGLFVGGGQHEMSVSVDVAPIDDEGREITST